MKMCMAHCPDEERVEKERSPGPCGSGAGSAGGQEARSNQLWTPPTPALAAEPNGERHLDSRLPIDANANANARAKLRRSGECAAASDSECGDARRSARARICACDTRAEEPAARAEMGRTVRTRCGDCDSFPISSLYSRSKEA